ncbi:hypothetical protein [Armatimonas sp.]|uniref:hypothetical protein n=1 Tax=Armatimonas sp. TaxID=1872638 RepID=UPI00286B4103|nr:hypothetical protein [Armatimonas sp.]
MLAARARALLAQKPSTTHQARFRLALLALTTTVLLVLALWFLATIGFFKAENFPLVLFGTFMLVCMVAVLSSALRLASKQRNRPQRQSPAFWKTTLRRLKRLIAGQSFRRQAEEFEMLLKDKLVASDLSTVLTLSRALFPLSWWMGETESHVHFACLTTLHRILPRATTQDIATLSTEERQQLMVILNFFLNTPTGWYLDTELPICIFLALASTRTTGLEKQAELTTERNLDPRLREAAREYLYAIQGG